MSLQDGEVPEALLVNVAFFCDKGGLSAIREAFQDANPVSLPFPLAHHLINIVTQVKRCRVLFYSFHVPLNLYVHGND